MEITRCLGTPFLFNIPPIQFFVKSVKSIVKINIAQNKTPDLSVRKEWPVCYKHKAGRNICIARKNRTLQDSPVLKVLWRITETFLPPKAYRAGPALPRKRKILIISLQSQPTLVGWTHNTETKVVVAVIRVVVVPIRHGTVRSQIHTHLLWICVPRAAAQVFIKNLVSSATLTRLEPDAAPAAKPYSDCLFIFYATSPEARKTQKTIYSTAFMCRFRRHRRFR